MTQEEFLLKWNDHHASFFTIVEDLCRTEQLCDVTLACGGQVFETHKLILSVCSPYFRTLLNSRPDKHPIVYLKDVNPKHLEQLLSYMYRGEINVLQEDLGPLIETARGLQIKGLADAGNSDNSSNSKPPKPTHNGLPSHPLPQLTQPKRSRTSTPTSAPKIARIEPPRLPQVPVSGVSPSNPMVEESGESIVEVDPTEGATVKQEMSQWMMGSGGDSNEGEENEGMVEGNIPHEQYEQDMQAEDEQYIHAGSEGLTGQQDEKSSKSSESEGEYPFLAPSVSLTPQGLSSDASGSTSPWGRVPSPGVSPPPSYLPLKCPTCDKQFPVPSLLERHMRTHTNERPYQCRFCGRSYSQSGNLNVHLKTIHGVSEGGREGAGTGTGTREDSLRPHKCYICNRIFTTSSNMYQHVRIVHNIMIETSKSPVMSGGGSPGGLVGGGAGASQVPASKASAQLEHWAQFQLNELKSLSGGGSSEQSLPPSQSSASSSRVSSGGFKMAQEPTIQDTLQQLSALAGGKGGKGNKGAGSSIFMMDQNKPIRPGDEDSGTIKIKKEKE